MIFAPIGEPIPEAGVFNACLHRSVQAVEQFLQCFRARRDFRFPNDLSIAAYRFDYHIFSMQVDSYMNDEILPGFSDG